MPYFPSYPRYKCHLPAWLSSIPEHWETTRLKFLVSVNDDTLDESTDPDTEIEYVDISSVSLLGGIEQIEHLVFGKAPSRARRLVKDGDIIISTVRTYLKAIAAVRKPSDKLVVSTGFAVLRPTTVLHPDFAAYFVQSNGFIGEVVARSAGVSYPAINPSELVRIPAVLPPKDEQLSISRFLDFKTKQIDALIDKRRVLLEKLAEKRKSLIRWTVTKGIHRAVSMKHSGSPWLGSVPAHWKILPLKFAVMFQRGHDLPAAERVAGAVPLVSSSGISSSHDVAIAKGPGIVTGRYGTIGEFTYVEEDYWPLNTTLYSVEMYGNNARYLWYMMQLLADIFIMNSKKGAVPGVDRNDLHPVSTVLPPKDEQIDIVDYLDRETRKLDEQASKIRDIIERTLEYRAALISDAVTGQIDVRKVSIPGTEAPADSAMGA